jgi:hypothetical protein
MQLSKKLIAVMMVSLSIFTTACKATSGSVGELEKAQAESLKNYTKEIISDGGVYRNYKNTEELNRVSSWIKTQMNLFGIPCEYQNFQANNSNYRNVVCSLNVGKPKQVIVGAHYDVYGEQEGADDNASGVAGVIETARILAKEKQRLNHNIEFVYYTLEEPPYFKTDLMGSYIHAKSVSENKKNIAGVYVLEMIGYFDEDDTQTYPLGLGLFYPKHGNYIAAISNFSSRKLGKEYCKSMKILNRLECEKLVGPSFIQGVDYSDHANYWKFDIPAIMITDTSFFRNYHYHTTGDNLSILDFNKMAHVVDGLTSHLIATQ